MPVDRRGLRVISGGKSRRIPPNPEKESVEKTMLKSAIAYIYAARDINGLNRDIKLPFTTVQRATLVEDDLSQALITLEHLLGVLK